MDHREFARVWYRAQRYDSRRATAEFIDPTEEHDEMWNLSAPPEFQGLRDDLPLTVYFRHLPHWRQEGATYFVTFRLIDALPKAKLHELRRLRTEWAEHQELPANFRDAVEWSTLKFKNHDNLEELYEEAMRRIDKRLDLVQFDSIHW